MEASLKGGGSTRRPTAEEASVTIAWEGASLKGGGSTRRPTAERECQEAAVAALHNFSADPVAHPPLCALTLRPLLSFFTPGSTAAFDDGDGTHGLGSDKAHAAAWEKKQRAKRRKRRVTAEAAAAAASFEVSE